MACAPSEDLDQPGHSPSLISLRCPHEENLGPSLPIERTANTLIRLGDAKADLSLRWAQSNFVGFVMRRSVSKHALLLICNLTVKTYCSYLSGAFAKQLAETKKKQLEEQLLRYENIKNIKLEYREYLEHCVAKCQSGEVIFQKAVNEINYDLKRLHDVGAELQSKFDSLKEVYKRHDALMLVRRRHSWKDYTSELSGIERRGNPRVCMSDEGGVSKQYPTVTLENHCFFRETTGQDLCPKKVGRAWILHAGSLYLQAGGYHFWEDYYQSQIRPFVTLAEGRNDEVLVFLTQISGFVGQWSRNDLEMSGQPYFESITTDRHGSSFVLGESGENIVYVHRDSNVAKVI